VTSERLSRGVAMIATTIRAVASTDQYQTKIRSHDMT
jgi:hypothetical protein